MRRNRKPKRITVGFVLVLAVFLAAGLLGGYFLFRQLSLNSGRSGRVIAWLRNPAAYSQWAVTAGQQCASAPFLLPSSGYIGFLWDDSFRIGHRHTGIDIFGGTKGNETPVVAAYSGYLTRLPEWKSSIIIRIPADPLQPERQIWTYYTHLAGPEGESFISAEFPPGTVEKFVPAGTLLGYQGNFSGSAGNPTGVHLHFSIVLDDGSGKFLNELEIENTLDPSPYLGIPLNDNLEAPLIPICQG